MPNGRWTLASQLHIIELNLGDLRGSPCAYGVDMVDVALGVF